MKKTTGLIAVIAILLFSAIGISAAENYAYTVNDVYFTDLEDNRLNGYMDGCMVNVDVTKNLSTSTKDIIVLSVYDSDNKFSGLYLMRGTINQGEERSFGMSFSMPGGIETGKIKAFVVSSLSTMTPLSGVTSVDVTGAIISELDTFVTLPSGSIEEFAENPPCIRAYPTKDSELISYYLSNNFSLYVNGEQIDIYQPIIDKYFLDSEYDITLVDKYPADGKYDEVRTEYYYTGMVEGVSRNKIYFEDGNIAYATEDAEIAITHNGEEKDVSYIEPGDVLTIQCQAAAPFSESAFYNIIVSRETAEGTLESFNDTEETITFNGKKYATIDYPIIKDDENIKIGYDYKLYLDYKGRIFKAELLSSNTNYAIIDKYSKSSSDDYYRATLILPGGEQITPEVDTAKTALSDDDLLNITYSSMPYKNPVSQRLVEYKLSADKSTIISINPAPPEVFATKTSYSSSNQSIDAVSIGDKTKIIKVDDSYNPTIVEPISVSELEDGLRYNAYAYGEILADGSYPLVMITAWEDWTQSKNTRFAVVYDYTGIGINEEGDNIYNLTVMYKQDGEDSASTHNLVIKEDSYVNGNIIDESTYFNKGDIIIFHDDKEGNVDEIFTLADADRFGFGDSYSTMIYNAFSNSPISSVTLPIDWSTDISRAKYENHVIAYGPILSKSSASFKMAIPTNISSPDGTDYIATDLTNTNTFLDVKTNSDTIVYVWDFAKQPKYRLLKAEGTIQPSIIPSAYKLNGGKFIPFARSDGTPISEATDCLNFAFVRIANGYAKEVFIFLAP